ncbi:hypothetical protein EV368DRAFT_64459 [Lentinula lateritia]|nr:hypothetical protein EV368DRAFT_64459 [Lentinula lateritia]
MENEQRAVRSLIAAGCLVLSDLKAYTDEFTGMLVGLDLFGLGTTHGELRLPDDLSDNTNKSLGYVQKAAISTTVQLFQGWRIRSLTKSNFVFGSIAFTAFVSLAAGLTTTILIALHTAWSQLQMFESGFLAWLIASAICDVVIAISLTWFVLRNKTPFTSTNSILNRIMLLTLQTGTITAVAAIADVFTFTISEGIRLGLLSLKTILQLFTFDVCRIWLNARVEWNELLDPPSVQTQSDVSFFHVEVFHHTENPLMRYDTSDQVMRLEKPHGYSEQYEHSGQFTEGPEEAQEPERKLKSQLHDLGGIQTIRGIGRECQYSESYLPQTPVPDKIFRLHPRTKSQSGRIKIGLFLF